MLTDHARARMQQRGIRPNALEALLDFGREARAARGREIIFFDKKARPGSPKRTPSRRLTPSASATATRSSRRTER